MKNKSIILYCNWNIFIDENEYVWLPSVHAQYIRALKNLGFTKITLMSKISSKLTPQHDYCINKDDIKIIPISYFSSYFKSIIKLPSIIKSFWLSTKEKSDYIYIRTYEPFIYLLVLFFTFFSSKTKRHMHYIADPKSAIFSNASSRYITKILRYSLFLPDYYLTNISSLLCNVTSNGPVPIKNTPFFVKRRIKEVIESAILESDLVSYKSIPSDNINLKINLLYVGYIRPSKGIDVLIDAVSYLHNEDKIDNFSVTIIGDGDYLNKIEEKIKKNKIQNYFIFTGYIPFSPELFNYYSNADIFINVSPSETGPRVLLEAGIFNCYLISTKVGYAPLLVNNNGILIDINDTQQLRKALIYAINNINYIIKDEKIKIENEKLKKYTTENFFRSVFNDK
ncbi:MULTISPECIES: glycosyltransferase family 4 protein [unclassified Providencia]|uniref:glycosyltransferase family 4 protein n=1 Tax=unclassified Providencia TaxID=2633465 RepID=UPI002349260A|nr:MULTISPECIES: glycosyltransferase family 4 protein [unclassified Providencia]